MKTILKSLAAIVAVGAIAGGATFAYFSDEERVNNNRITAGTLDLVINPDGTPGMVPVVFDDAYPGQTASQNFKVKNNGTIRGHLRMDIDPSSIVNEERSCTEPERDIETDCVAPGLGELCDEIDVKLERYTGGGNTEVIFDSTDSTSYGVNVATGEIEFDDANVDMPAGATATFRLTTSVDSMAGNEIQSDRCGADFIIGLVQDVDGDGTADEDE